MVLFWAWAADLGVGHPGLLELVEEELVPFIEGEAEPVVQLLDDFGQQLQLGLVLLAPALTEDALHLPGLGVERQRSLEGDLTTEVGQLDLGPRSSDVLVFWSRRRDARARQ